MFLRKISQQEQDEARALCVTLGVEHLFQPDQVDFRVDHLSGGEKRRLALLRNLVRPKPILLLDEPTSELDHAHGAIVCDILSDLPTKHTILVATHDQALIKKCDLHIIVGGQNIILDTP